VGASAGMSVPVHGAQHNGAGGLGLARVRRGVRDRVVRRRGRDAQRAAAGRHYILLPEVRIAVYA
jgi:hypothetical protein